MTVTKAAGILFLAPGNRVLFLKRGPGGDYPGYWCLPGGRTESGESAEETAVREANEEVGPIPSGARTLLSRCISEVAGTPLPVAGGGEAPAAPLPDVSPPVPSVDFTTFVQKVDEEFSPVPDDEHVGFAWAPAGDPPAPTHPGVAVAVEMLSADELGIARLMAAGRVTSPQRYKNVTLWAMRITGTGVSYRPKIDEYVLRNPDLYLNEEFLARCNGLAVVMYHPKKSTLDSDAFSKSVIGSIMLPYLKGNEVWGIAKVYDDSANAAMTEEQLSTSPGVILAHPDSPSYKMLVEDGTGKERQILVEGKPSLLDHVAVCALGVWDKGDDPTGIILNDSSTVNDSTGEDDMPMTAEEKKEITDSVTSTVMDAVRKDADERASKMDATLDKVLKGIDSVGCRLDSFDEAEKARKDAAEEEEKKKADAAKMDSDKSEEEKEKEKADAAKKDADEKKEKEEKEKADAAKNDSATSTAALAARIALVEANVPKARTDADRTALIATQAKYDPLFHAFGDSAPAPMNGEAVVDYRIRLASKFKDRSPVWKAANLSIIAGDEAALDAAEGAIYADAMAAALTPATVADGEIRMIPGKTESGHKVNRFVGDPRAAYARFTGSRRALPDMTNSLQKYSTERRSRPN